MADGKLGGSIGDISSLLHNQGVSDLSWLSVDESEYREGEALPKQNLDIIPELQRALYQGEEGVPTLIPLKPHTIVNRNPNDFPPNVAPLDSVAPIRNRVAQYVMSGVPNTKMSSLISQEFSKDEITAASSAIEEVISESGLLGNVYINSSHFPTCSTSSKVQKFVKHNSSKDALILAKDKCSDCVYAQSGCCSVLGNRKIVDSINYNSSLAAQHAPRLASEGRPIDVSANSSWKSKLQDAYRQSFSSAPISSGLHTLSKKSSALLNRNSIEDIISSPIPDLSSDYVRYSRRMMEGHDDRASIISSGDVQSKTLASQFGILGHSVIDIDTLGDCQKALKFLDGDIPPEFFIRRSSVCPYCSCSESGPCSKIESVSRIVSNFPKLGLASLSRAIDRALSRGSINNSQASVARKRISSNIANVNSLISSINTLVPAPEQKQEKVYQGPKYKFAPTSSNNKPVVDRQKVRSFVSHLMNNGYTGVDLTSKIYSVWDKSDIESVSDVIEPLIKMDGIQGKVYIDPTAYSDYGRGCTSGSSSLRSSSVPFVLASDKCTGCLLQTSSGWCSKYAKGLVRSIPDSVVSSIRSSKSEVQRTASAPIVDLNSKFGLEKSEISFETGSSEIPDFEIQISGKIID